MNEFLMFSLEKKMVLYRGEGWMNYDEPDFFQNVKAEMDEKINTVVLVGRSSTLKERRDEIQSMISEYKNKNKKVILGLITSVNALSDQDKQILSEIDSHHKIVIKDNAVRYFEMALVQMMNLKNDIDVSYEDFETQFSEAAIVWFYGVDGTHIEAMAEHIIHDYSEDENNVTNAIYLVRGDASLLGIGAVSSVARSTFPNADIMMGTHIDDAWGERNCFLFAFYSSNKDEMRY